MRLIGEQGAGANEGGAEVLRVFIGLFCRLRGTSLLFAEEMNPTLVITNAGRRPDGCYVAFLIIFWIIWTPETAWATLTAITDFSFFWLLWLPFGYVGVFGIPYMLIQSRKPQTLEATPDSLVIHGTGIPFARVIEIPRGQGIKLHFGHYDDGSDGESVATLNIFSGTSWWTKRVMIAPLSHPEEKRQIFRDLQTFLSENGFRIHVEDEHPKTRSEQDAPSNGGQRSSLNSSFPPRRG